jgi:hypothetical protein
VACAVIRRAIAEGHADSLDEVETEVFRAMWTPRYLPVRYEPHRATFLLNERVRIDAMLHG